MTLYTRILDRAAAHALTVLGAFHPDSASGVPEGTRTLVLLGPAEPGFWAHVTAQPEWADGRPDPLDRWSERAVGAIARACGARALFPFGGPPHHPFHTWALRSGRAWASPVGFLVHERAGLMVSYRGALAFRERLTLRPVLARNPCNRCAGKPCLTACPVGALTGAGYDLDACHGWLDTPDGQDCMSRGCAARRACPLSQSYARLPEQSAYHMSLFHK